MSSGQREHGAVVVRRLFSIVAVVAFLACAPALAEPSPIVPRTERAVRPPSTPSVAAVEQAVGEMGDWTLAYSALVAQASQVMDEVDNCTAVLDRFANGQIREREALRQMEAWRANAISRGQALRVEAAALRDPPSLTVFGERGAALREALETSRGDLPVLVDQMISVLDALGALGSEAIRNPTKTADARRRAVFTSNV